MKYLPGLCLSLFIVISVTTVRADTVELSDATAEPGDTVEVYVHLDNSVTVGGLQLDVCGSPAEDISWLSARAVGRTEGWTVSAQVRGDTLRMMVFSATGSGLAAASDSVVVLGLYLAPDAVPGTVIDLELSGVIVSDTDLNRLSDISLVNGSVTVEGNVPPVASCTGLPANGNPPLEVTLDATGSSDQDGSITDYSWDFGDGGTGSGSTVTHSFGSVGTYTVTLTVRDDGGAETSVSQQVEVFEQGAYRRGDVDRDGKTDIFDLLELLAILAGRETNDY